MGLPRQQLFTNKALVRLVVPLLLESAFGILVGVVDSIMVSSVGEAAISGVSLVTNISGILLNFSGALAAGGAVVTSQFLGAGKKKDACRSAGQLITMATAVSFLITGICLLFSRQMLALFFGKLSSQSWTQRLHISSTMRCHFRFWPFAVQVRLFSAAGETARCPFTSVCCETL